MTFCCSEIPALEGVALGLLEELGDPCSPISAFSLAETCGLRIVRRGRRARLHGDTIELPAGAGGPECHRRVIHELGHWALQRADEDDSEAGADHVGMALMLPRREFDLDLRATWWDLRKLEAKHVHCAPEMLAARIASMRDAHVTIWEGGRVARRLASPWVRLRRRVSPLERELMERVLASGEDQDGGNLLWAFAVEGRPRRVITVCDDAQVAMRF